MAARAGGDEMAATVAVGRVQYWPAMDGMRAVAILAVLLCHVGLLPGGIFGVDVFFVLSGFLITSILLDESRSRARISIRRFYERRALRLLPGVVVSVAVAALVGQAVLTAQQRGLLGHDVVWITAYAQNFHETFGLANPMLDQYWSLSMEEQFYVLWSLILVALLALRLDRKRIAEALLALSVLSTAWGSLLEHWGESASRLSTMIDTRAEGLVVGCALAVLFIGRPVRINARRERALSYLAFLSGLVLLILFRFSSRNINRLTAFSVHGGFLIIAAATGVIVWNIVVGGQGSFVSKILRHPILVWIGKLSYSLYLVHKIFYTAFLTLGLPRVEWILLSISTSLAAAAMLHYGVELPFLKLKRRFSSSGAGLRGAAEPAVPLVVAGLGASEGEPR